MTTIGTESVRIPLYRRGDPIPRGYALVDADDAPRVMQYTWRPANSGRYARAKIARGFERVYLHQFIAGTTNVDHRNGNGLDNRRLNLRACTRAQNLQNMRLPRTNKSGYTKQRSRPTGRGSTLAITTRLSKRRPPITRRRGAYMASSLI